jgi:hypothetical protein
MHFSRIALFALPALAAASAIMPRNDNPCGTEYNNCCDETYTVCILFVFSINKKLKATSARSGFAFTGAHRQS